MLLERAQQRLQEKADSGLLRQLRIRQTPTSPHQSFFAHDGERQLLGFASNDYLGLAQHPAVITALQEGAQRWGVGAGASHLISGHTQAHQDLENKLTHWFKPYIPQVVALSFSTGYMANMAVLTTLGEADAHIFSDALNHASLIDGCRLARATVSCYAHLDITDLAHQLQQSTAPIKIIVTDGVFSMDGDLAPLAAMLELAQAHDAYVMVDDAHGIGVIGTLGRGLIEHVQARSERLIWVGTFGKAVGVAGAFVAACQPIVDWIIQSARSYIYTTASLPAQAQAISTSLDWIEGPWGQQQRLYLQTLITYWQEGWRRLKEQKPDWPWHILPSTTPIQPLWVGENDSAVKLAQHLYHEGIHIPAIRPPTVAPGQARLRITLSAAHHIADIDVLLQSLKRFTF
jgi:8-amino-7-oxononanoate synthase